MVAKKTAAESADGIGTTEHADHADNAAVAKKAVAKRAAAKETAAKKSAAKKAVAKKAAPAKKAPAEKAAAKRAAPAAKGAAAAAEETGAKTVVAKKTASRTTGAKKAATATTTGLPASLTVAPAAPGELAVRPGEDPWTPDEVAEARAALEQEVAGLRAEIIASEEAVTGLMRDSGDGAGDDQADTGTKNISREYELALAASARERLEQTERALERLDAGTYGLCEVCGKPIGKARMQAFPRATLCVEDKQKQERRY
ncbi:TraR/DksA family transcriptional regulator [Streptomyces sp. ISL-96]|uniref:TraR/DksA family transcriptional regulator n=1 Tax=Streptomyces sp. ISL-96 TaxID=2819191 RepID=UPI001BE99304|nr:TraR/DksA family transcriptional regulator [Streptomyces sp. ISL-96]MBT2487049.1 TraR/DksA family transcriptional regulator [Streptomyces sp. ISL-96]